MESLERMLEEMRQNGVVPTQPAENEVCRKHYEKWTSTLRRSYSEALQKENLEAVYTFNRRMGPVLQQISGFALAQHTSALFAMGMFSGVFAAMSDMLPQRSREQTFHMQMAVLKERAYVKQILKLLYDGGCVQHKQICGKINVSASQLSRTMSDLIEAGCVERYRSGRASVYMLTSMGKKYIEEFLGYKKLSYLEYDRTMLAGRKPQIEQKEDVIADIQAYCIVSNAGKGRREKNHILAAL